MSVRDVNESDAEGRLYTGVSIRTERAIARRYGPDPLSDTPCAVCATSGETKHLEPPAMRTRVIPCALCRGVGIVSRRTAERGFDRRPRLWLDSIDAPEIVPSWMRGAS